MAAKDPNAEIDAVTVVAGNVPLDYGVQNALYTLELCKREIPVYGGLEKPLIRPLETAQFVHGEDGMGDIGLPLSGRKAAAGHAVTELCDRLIREGDAIDLITLGPLTNVAAALQLEPSIAKRVGECVVMGGTGRGPGNVTPVAEFNIWVDPEAAKIVFESGMRIKMVGWEIACGFAYFREEDIEKLRSVGTPLARFCVDIQKTLIEFASKVSGVRGFDMPDPVAMAVALDPGIVLASELRHVAIATDGLCRGQTVVDHLQITGNAHNVEIVTEVSRDGFLEMLYESVGGPGEWKS